MKKQHLTLNEAEERYLTEFIRRGQARARVVRRAMALLQLHRGATLQAVADILQVEHWTVSTWRNKYLAGGLDFLTDAPRSGRPVEIDGGQRAKITALACADAPAGHARWSLRLLAEKVVELEFCAAVSPTAVGTILKKTNSCPT